jgi:hypothetical protein
MEGGKMSYKNVKKEILKLKTERILKKIRMKKNDKHDVKWNNYIYETWNGCDKVGFGEHTINKCSIGKKFQTCWKIIKRLPKDNLRCC